MLNAKIIYFLFLFHFNTAFAQNVGIGTTLPSGRLQLNHRATFANPTLLLYDSSINNFGGPVLQFQSNGMNRFNIKGSLESSTNPAMSFLDYFYNGSYLGALNGEGRMLLGALDPHGRLRVNHRATFLDPTLVLYDSSTAGAGRVKFYNAGGSRYWQFYAIVDNSSRANQFFDILTDSSTIMTITGNGRVGINNIGPLYNMDVNGTLNVTGLVRVDGNAGTSGQALLSAGTAASPVWTNIVQNPQLGFHARPAINQDIPQFSYTRIQLNDVVFNDGSDFDATTDSYIVPVTGVYSIQVQVGFFSANPGYYQVYLDDNTTLADGQLATAVNHITVANRLTINLDITLRLTAGTSLVVMLTHSAVGDATVTSGVYTHFSGFRVY
jgi:hypothetical protein